MKYYLKNQNFQKFLKKFTELGEAVKSINDKDEFINSKDIIKNYLEKNILPNSLIFTDFLEKYEYSIIDKFRETEFKMLQNQKKQYEKNIRLLIDYFQMSESLKDKSIDLLFDNITDKTDFLLEKLKNVFNNNDFYSIELLFKINDIEYRENENIEIAKDLKRRGYIILENEYSESDLAKISVKGANYIERRIKSKNKKITKKFESDLNKKLDIVLEKLTKLGFGQEIIFEEIEDLKNLQTKLSKKTWTQLLKGKLIDLAMDGIINKESASEIFEFLTDTSLKLLK